VNVEVIVDPIGRLVWISSALPGARHDMGAAREHGIIDAFTEAGVRAVGDTAYQSGRSSDDGSSASSPPRPRCLM
jgi:hypothetical protein